MEHHQKMLETAQHQLDLIQASQEQLRVHDSAQAEHNNSMEAQIRRLLASLQKLQTQRQHLESEIGRAKDQNVTQLRQAETLQRELLILQKHYH